MQNESLRLYSRKGICQSRTGIYTGNYAKFLYSKLITMQNEIAVENCKIWKKIPFYRAESILQTDEFFSIKNNRFFGTYAVHELLEGDKIIWVAYYSKKAEFHLHNCRLRLIWNKFPSEKLRNKLEWDNYHA